MKSRSLKKQLKRATAIFLRTLRTILKKEKNHRSTLKSEPRLKLMKPEVQRLKVKVEVVPVLSEVHDNPVRRMR